MPQLVFLAAVGIAAWYGYKTIKKGMSSANDTLRKSEKKKATNGGGKLKKDPKTGVYKLDKDS